MSRGFVLGLAAIALGLIAYIVVFERGSLSTKELDERKGRVLRTFVRDQVTALGLTRGGQSLRLERTREDDGSYNPWRLSEPLRTPADQDSVDRLLGELEWLSARRILEQVPKSELGKLGLTKPRFRLVYRVSGEDYTFLVGGPDVQGDNHYAAYKDDDTVYVVPKTLVEALDHELGHFRAKEFLGDITSAWAERLTLSEASHAVSLQKQEGNWWVLEEPKSLADGRVVKELIDGLDGLRAVRFLEGAAKEAAQRALAASARVVELRVVPDVHREDKSPQRFLLRVGGDCAGHPGERYAQADEKGDPVCVRAEDVQRFSLGAEELRLTRLFAADVSEIERVEVAADNVRFTLKREGEKWVAEGLAGPVERESVEAWLRDIADVRAEGFTAKKPLQTSISLTLHLASEAKLSLTADASDPSALWVQRQGEPVVVRFPALLGDRLRPFAQRFVPLALWPERQPSQVTALSARHGNELRKLLFEQGSFRMRAGAAPVSDSEHVRELVREVVKGSAISLVGERARTELGLDQPSAVLTLTLTPGTQLTLELGRASPRGLFARVDGARIVEVDARLAGLVAELATGRRTEVDAGSDAALPPAATGGAGDEYDDREHEDEHDHEH